MKKCFSDPAVFKQLETDCYNAGCKAPLKLPEDVTEALRTALAVISAARSENVTEKTVLQKLTAMSTVKSTASPQK